MDYEFTQAQADRFSPESHKRLADIFKVLTDKRRPCKHRAFVASRQLDRHEVDDRFTHDGLDVLLDQSHRLIEEFGEALTGELLGRGPHVVDIRMGCDYSPHFQSTTIHIDTITNPCQIRNDYYGRTPCFNSSSLELNRPRLARPHPRLHIDDRWQEVFMPTLRKTMQSTTPPGSPASSKTELSTFWTKVSSGIRKINQDLVYDGPSGDVGTF